MLSIPKLISVVQFPTLILSPLLADHLVRLRARRGERDHGQGCGGDVVLPGDAARAPLRLGNILMLPITRGPRRRQRPRPQG